MFVNDNGLLIYVIKVYLYLYLCICTGVACLAQCSMFLFDFLFSVRYVLILPLSF